MNELVQILREFTPGAWGIWTGVLILAGWIIKQIREDRQLSHDDRLARREGYAAQVANLMQFNRSLLEDIAELRKEYDNHRKICQMETDQLRRMVIDLEGEIAGLKRNRAVDEIHNIKIGGGPVQ